MLRNRVPAFLVAAPLALLSFAGCADSDGGNGSGGSAEVTGASAAAEQNLAFAQCLREHGIDVPDPKPGEGVRLPSNKSAKQDKVDAAMRACKQFVPQPPAAEVQKERENMLKYAKCMRGHGVENFADPRPGEGIHVGPEVMHDPDFKAAEKACAEAMGLDRERNVQGG